MKNDDAPYALKPGDTVVTGSLIRKDGGGLPGGGAHTYQIKKPIADAESTGLSYEAIKLEKNKNVGRCFIKIPKLERGVSDSETKNYLKEIYFAFSSEYQNRDRFEKNRNVAKVEDFGTYEFPDRENKRNLIIPFLVQEFVDGQTLIEHLHSNSKGKNQSAAIKDEKDFFTIAKEIVKAVKRIHNQQVIHGDIRPKNIRLQSNAGETVYRLVGFTRSFLLDQAFQTRSGGTLPPHRYRAPECVRSNDHWYTPADIYSLGGVLYYLATGQDPPQPNDDEKTLKNEILEGIKGANESLYKQNEGIVKIIDKCMRYDPEERYAYAESIYSALQTFDYSYQQEHINVSSLKSSLKVIETNASRVISNKNAFFANIILQKLSLLQEEVEAIENNHYEIYGAREDIIDSLVRYLSVLEKGDQYLTVTKPAYWTPQNLGINGRFLTMNKVMATKGVIVRRVFLLTEDEARSNTDVKHDKEIFEILEAHQEATKDMEEVHGMEVDKFQIPDVPQSKAHQFRNSFYTGFRILSRDEIDKYEREVSHVALWRKSNGDQMSILFISRPTLRDLSSAKTPRSQKGDRIVKVRFWKSEKQEGFLKEIEQHLEQSTPIKQLWPKKDGAKK